MQPSCSTGKTTGTLFIIHNKKIIFHVAIIMPCVKHPSRDKAPHRDNIIRLPSKKEARPVAG
jgi:hypothetical protein